MMLQCPQMLLRGIIGLQVTYPAYGVDLLAAGDESKITVSTEPAHTPTSPQTTPTATPLTSTPVTRTPTPVPATVTPTLTEKVLGFEVVFAIAGLLAIAYLVLRRNK